MCNDYDHISENSIFGPSSDFFSECGKKNCIYSCSPNPSPLDWVTNPLMYFRINFFSCFSAARLSSIHLGYSLTSSWCQTPVSILELLTLQAYGNTYANEFED